MNPTSELLRALPRAGDVVSFEAPGSQQPLRGHVTLLLGRYRNGIQLAMVDTGVQEALIPRWYEVPVTALTVLPRATL